jgi:RimJ/RimL family protein N-acetyltransferase
VHRVRDAAGVFVRIRRARPDDAATLAKAEQTLARTPGRLVSRPHELKAENFRRSIEELRTAGLYVVAEEGGLVVGHALLVPMPLEAIAHVFRLTIMVHEGHQGRGVGTALMKHLMDWARRDPRCLKIELGVRSVNTRAIRLYKKLGFKLEGRLKKRLRMPDGTFIDDLLMGWLPDGKAPMPRRPSRPRRGH